VGRRVTSSEPGPGYDRPTKSSSGSSSSGRPEQAGLSRAEPVSSYIQPPPVVVISRWSSGWTPILGIGLVCALLVAAAVANAGNSTHTASPTPSVAGFVAGAATDSPASQPLTPGSTPTEMPTPIPAAVELTSFSVPVASSDGYSFKAPRDGVYRFRYAGGAYSTYKSDAVAPKPSWLTSVCASSPQEVPWTNGVIPAAGPKCLFVVGWTGAAYWSSSESTNAAQGMSGQTVSSAAFAPPAVRLSAGETIVFRAVDDEVYDAYSDNRGTLSISVWLA